MDEIDRRIIRCLQLDGRKTLREIGKAVGYTGMGVKKRIEKLLAQNVIKVSALLNVEALNLYSALIFMELENKEARDRILNRFRECPRIINMFITLAGYNLIALVIAEDRETLESESVEKCSLRGEKGIRRSEFYPIGTIYYDPFLKVRETLARREMDVAPCQVNCGSCERYEAKKCLGCPATKYYLGPL